MKKFIYTLLFLAFSSTTFSQVWIEGFAVYSIPVKAWMASGERYIEIDGYEPVTIPESDLFTTFADPGFGGGINLRYSKNRFAVGMEIAYNEYKPSTDLLRVNMFRLGPNVEYYFIPIEKSKFHPYVGAEISLGSSKIHYNGDVIDEPKLAETHLGGGPRAGLVYSIGPKWVFRIGAKYIYMKKLPYFDITAGIAVNLGDF
jgi:hypothetical protein